MTRCCELTGKTVLFGNKVSHSNIKTKRKYKPNIQKKGLLSDVLGRALSFRVSTNGMKCVEAAGGLDQFLMKRCEADLSLRAKKAKKSIMSCLEKKKVG